MSFKDKVAQISQEASDRYLKDGIEPTKTISKYASIEKLSSTQIDRVVNKTNRNILVSLQKEAVAKDPHFTFPLAKTAEVIGMIDTKAKAKLPDVKRMAGLPLPVVAKEDGIETLKSNLGKLAELKVERSIASASLDRAASELYKLACYAYMNAPENVMDAIQSSFDDSCSVAKSFRLAKKEVGTIKTASVKEFEIEKEHPLYKKAHEVSELENKYNIIKEVYDGCYRKCYPKRG